MRAEFFPQFVAVHFWHFDVCQKQVNGTTEIEPALKRVFTITGGDYMITAACQEIRNQLPPAFIRLRVQDGFGSGEHRRLDGQTLRHPSL